GAHDRSPDRSTTMSKATLIVLAMAGAALVAGRAGWGADPAGNADEQESKESPKAPATKPPGSMAPAQGDQARRRVELLVGDWDGEVKLWFAPDNPPVTFRESVKREPLFDNRFVIEHVEATSEMGPYHGLSVIGFDNAEKRYEMFFIDNGSTAMNT